MIERPRAMRKAGARAANATLKICLRPCDHGTILQAFDAYAPTGLPSERVMAAVTVHDLEPHFTGSGSVSLTGFQWGFVQHVLANVFSAEKSRHSASDPGLWLMWRWIRMRRRAHPVIGPWLTWDLAFMKVEAEHAKRERVLQRLKAEANAALANSRHG